MIDKKCIICDIEIHKKYNESVKSFNNRKFCSVDCYNKSKLGKKTWNKGLKLSKKHCKNLSISHKGYKHTEEQKAKIRQSLLGRKRSPEICKKIGDAQRCKKTGRIAWNKGKKSCISGSNHPMWKGGITDAMRLLRQCLEYKEWRLNVYKRDYYTCQTCNKKLQSKEIVAHHIKRFSDYPELRFKVYNGITLCRKCHGRLHKNNA